MHALILLGVWPEYLTCLIAYSFDGERQRLASKEARYRLMIGWRS